MKGGPDVQVSPYLPRVSAASPLTIPSTPHQKSLVCGGSKTASRLSEPSGSVYTSLVNAPSPRPLGLPHTFVTS